VQASRRTTLVAGLAVAGMLAVSGRGSDSPDDQATVAPTSTGSEDNNWNTPGSSRKWLGCRLTQSDGFAASITATTITGQSIRESPRTQWTPGEQSTIAGRAAITFPREGSAWAQRRTGPITDRPEPRSSARWFDFTDDGRYLMQRNREHVRLSRAGAADLTTLFTNWIDRALTRLHEQEEHAMSTPWGGGPR